MGCRLEETISGKGKKHYKLISGPNLALSLTFDEALAIFIGCHTSPAYDGAGLGQAARSSLDKLRQALGPLEMDYIQRTIPKFHRSQVGGDYSRHGGMLDDLQVAIEDQLILKVQYLAADRQSALSYDIHPYGLVEHRGTLYIVGYSGHRRAIRTWKLERFKEIELTRTKFDRPIDFELQNYFQDAFAVIVGQQLQTVKIRFDASVARYVAEKQVHSSQRIDELPDGSAIVQFELSSWLEVKSWIMSFGSQAEVLEPSELRVSIGHEVERMSAAYRAKTKKRSRRPSPK